jgi:hypothetical protein
VILVIGDSFIMQTAEPKAGKTCFLLNQCQMLRRTIETITECWNSNEARNMTPKVKSLLSKSGQNTKNNSGKSKKVSSPNIFARRHLRSQQFFVHPSNYSS